VEPPPKDVTGLALVPNVEGWPNTEVSGDLASGSEYCRLACSNACFMFERASEYMLSAADILSASYFVCDRG
jgi:hypothetical protein